MGRHNQQAWRAGRHHLLPPKRPQAHPNVRKKHTNANGAREAFAIATFCPSGRTILAVVASTSASAREKRRAPAKKMQGAVSTGHGGSFRLCAARPPTHTSCQSEKKRSPSLAPPILFGKSRVEIQNPLRSSLLCKSGTRMPTANAICNCRGG